MEEVFAEGEEEELGEEEESWEEEMRADNRSKYEWEAICDAFEGKVDARAEHAARASVLDVALWESAAAGDAGAVEELLRQGADANHRAGATHTLPVLSAAAALGHELVVAALIAHGARVDAVDGEGWTALHMAADRGHVSVVRSLHAAGALLDARVQVVDKSFSAYYAAEEHGEDESNDMEVDEGALHWLALAEDTNRACAMVDCLCDLGATVDIRTSTNCTALHWAVDSNNIPVARQLIERGADINARTGFQDEIWWTPLTWAARQGLEDMVQMLLEKGADVFARCQDQRTALWWAEQNCFEDIADVLRKYGVADRAPIPKIDLVMSDSSEYTSDADETKKKNDALPPPPLLPLDPDEEAEERGDGTEETEAEARRGREPEERGEEEGETEVRRDEAEEEEGDEVGLEGEEEKEVSEGQAERDSRQGVPMR